MTRRPWGRHYKNSIRVRFEDKSFQITRNKGGYVLEFKRMVTEADPADRHPPVLHGVEKDRVHWTVICLSEECIRRMSDVFEQMQRWPLKP